MGDLDVNYSFISLGFNCQVSVELKRMGLPLVESPYEGMLIHNLPALINTIKSNNDDFFAWDNLRVNKVKKHVNIELPPEDTHEVVDSKWGITDVHNFPTTQPMEVSYALFMEERQKLIKPFLDILKNGDNVKILRTNWGKERKDKIVELRDIIYRFRAGKPFDLYVFQDSWFMRKNWGIKNLHTFKTQTWKWKSGEGWVGDRRLWENIFKKITTPEPTKLYL